MHGDEEEFGYFFRKYFNQENSFKKLSRSSHFATRKGHELKVLHRCYNILRK